MNVSTSKKRSAKAPRIILKVAELSSYRYLRIRYSRVLRADGRCK
jgi:hypothetical protein